jgi:Uma2 family endonuclease
MNWQEVCEHPNLRNLPFKIELTETGQILMSPVKVSHSAYQGEMIRTLPKKGKVLAECAIATRLGTKVADVAWVSRQRFKRLQHETECSIAPEICIEVCSAGNTKAEIEQKRTLYFEQGAQEVWVCDQMGEIQFYNIDGILGKSRLFPKFPQRIEL